MEIKMHRGDTKQLKFCRKSAGEIILEPADQIYFTVKRAVTPLPEEYVFQKTIEDMPMTEDGYYHLTIEPADTDELAFGQYDFDFQVTANDVKQTTTGTLTLLKEVTFSANEV